MGKCQEMFRPRAPVSRQMQVVGLRKLYLVDLIGDALNGPLGLSVFVLLGCVARTLAGPSVIISVIFAAVVAIIAGLCYAELGSSRSKTGTSSTLSLNLGSVGELVSFLVTWNLIADLAIGAAVAARGVRSSIDVITDDAVKKYFISEFPLDSNYTSEFVDFVALGIPILTSIICCALREIYLLKVANTIFAFVVFLFMIISGISVANSTYWTGPPSESFHFSTFLPFGMQNTFQGACVMAFAFVDLRKGAYPSRFSESNSPLAVILASASSFLIIFFVGVIVTMMVPLNEMIAGQEVISAFGKLQFLEGKWIVAISAILILSHGIISLTYTMAHELHSLASEHVIFKFLGNSEVFGRKRPLYGTLCLGLAAGLVGAFFKEEQLAEVISIGTLCSFGLICCSAIIHRCRYESHTMETCSYKQVLRQFLGCKKLKNATHATSVCVQISTALFSLLCVGGAALIVHFGAEIELGELWAVVTLIVMAVLALYVFSVIVLQPQNKSVDNFKVPLFPLFQGLGILFTSYLLMSMNHTAWYRLAIWSAAGFVIYFVNLCTRPQILSRPASKNGSYSDNLSLAAKSNNSIKSNSMLITAAGLERTRNSAEMREIEWKPEDERRNGWIEVEENEIEIPITVPAADIDSLRCISESPEDDPSQPIVEVVIPEIIITEILSTTSPADSPLAEHHTHDFYVKQVDEMFTFDEAGDAHSTTSSEESIAQVHAHHEEVLDEDTGEVTPPRRSGNSPVVHFNVDVASSSDDDHIENEHGDLEDAVIVTPSSPLPPPLPPASLLISPHLSARSRAVVVEAPLTSSIPEQQLEEEKEEKFSHLNEFQKELRNTLKLRSQKMIDSIENTVVNVNEGIEIFGGKRSRTTSSAEDYAAVVPTIKPGNKLENHAFVEKLDSILKNQLSDADKKPRAKVYKQKRVVVVEDMPVAPVLKAPPKAQPQMLFSTSELMSAKKKLRSSNGESVSLAGDVTFSDESNAPAAEPTPPKPTPRVKKTPKSLEAMGSDVNIMIIGVD